MRQMRHNSYYLTASSFKTNLSKLRNQAGSHPTDDSDYDFDYKECFVESMGAIAQPASATG